MSINKYTVCIRLFQPEIHKIYEKGFFESDLYCDSTACGQDVDTVLLQMAISIQKDALNSD